MLNCIFSWPTKIVYVIQSYLINYIISAANMTLIIKKHKLGQICATLRVRLVQLC
jgi:hypothetical protein